MRRPEVLCPPLVPSAARPKGPPLPNEHPNSHSDRNASSPPLSTEDAIAVAKVYRLIEVIAARHPIDKLEAA